MLIDYPKIIVWLGIGFYCVWFWVLFYYWIGSPLPGWIHAAVLK